IQERYSSREQYLKLVEEAAAPLVKEGYLLADDVSKITKRAGDHWDLLTRRATSARAERENGALARVAVEARAIRYVCRVAEEGLAAGVLFHVALLAVIACSPGVQGNAKSLPYGVRIIRIPHVAPLQQVLTFIHGLRERVSKIIRHIVAAIERGSGS